MSVGRKLFLTIASFIAVLALLFVFLSVSVVWGILGFTDPSLAPIAVASSVTFLLLVASAILIGFALLIAYPVSRRLTAPLRELIPAIERLGRGEYGVQVPVTSSDEYGTVARTFNAMSAQLRAHEEARRKLTADVAHELRTPLTILQGKLDLIQQSGEPVEPEALLPIQDELIRLTKLVEDLQQLSLAEAKKLPMEFAPTPVLPLLQRVADRVALDAEEKRITLEVTCSDPLPPVLMDANRMTQALLNLAANAVRYTPEGGSVKLHAGVLSESRLLQISISDTGIGIAPEHLPSLFDRFYRTDEARNRNSGGMGLGLAIAKQLVLNHGGDIHAESIPGAGTTFYVRLPLAANPQRYWRIQ